VTGTFRWVELLRAEFLVGIGNGVSLALAAKAVASIKIQPSLYNLNG